MSARATHTPHQLLSRPRSGSAAGEQAGAGVKGSHGFVERFPQVRGLADAVSRSVRDGSLESGSKLPPIRSVAATLSLAPTTVRNAWSQLAAAGLIFTDGGTDALDLPITSRVELGDLEATEDHVYPPLFDVPSSAGARVLSVVVDDDGLVPAPRKRP